LSPVSGNERLLIADPIAIVRLVTYFCLLEKRTPNFVHLNAAAWSHDRWRARPLEARLTQVIFR
jgi:hypothetical protein